MSSQPLRIIGIIVTAALLYGMQRTTPGYTEITGPIARRGEFGQIVKARSFAIRIEKVMLADSLRWQAFGRSYERQTGGRWAVVVATAESTGQTETLAGAVWRSDSGLRFEPSQRVASLQGSLNSIRLEPGLPRRGVLAFEIGRNESRNAELLISADRWPRLDTRLEIALPASEMEQASTLNLDTVLQ